MAVSNGEPAEEHIGQVLRKSGWRQGVLVDSATLLDVSNGGAELRTLAVIESGMQLIIASQTCDIVASPDREPLVESLLCAIDPNRGGSRLVNSSRFYPIDPKSKLIAYASKRVLIPKEILRALRPNGTIPDEPLRSMFPQWLADRWRRAEFPDEFNRDFTDGLKNAIAAEKKRDSDIWKVIKAQLYQFRALCMRHDGDRPIDVQLRALVRPSGRPAYLRTIRDFVDPIIELTNAVSGTPLRMERLGFNTPADFSLADAWHFRPVDFDYLSVDGEEIGLLADGPE